MSRSRTPPPQEPDANLSNLVYEGGKHQSYDSVTTRRGRAAATTVGRSAKSGQFLVIGPRSGKSASSNRPKK